MTFSAYCPLSRNLSVDQTSGRLPLFTSTLQSFVYQVCVLPATHSDSQLTVAPINFYIYRRRTTNVCRLAKIFTSRALHDNSNNLILDSDRPHINQKTKSEVRSPTAANDPQLSASRLAHPYAWTCELHMRVFCSTTN